ncbi:deoxycytidylate deaminase [Alsobacter metallidurans]|uniref:Deoxycytidylate deaminase n=1 Tax=Alsobacter metallidurans TaxID=340221 RepID=A0A917MGR1_9HYPH|nr:anti-phage dCTP deaminase [Alsobacter metallidurans]GGH16686.1 deoxycytidylate deaminase [Alsobacter metallidurans]
MIPTIEAPEIVIGLCSPIGTDNAKVRELIELSLVRFSYKTKIFKVTDLMKQVVLSDAQLVETPIDKRYDSYIRYANSIRDRFNDPTVLAVLCCMAVRSERRLLGEDYSSHTPCTTYVFDQFKRKEEIALLRQTYGRSFILISIYSDKNNRIKNLSERIASDHSHPRPKNEDEQAAKALIERDEDERDERNGQRLQDAFALADLFINIDNEAHAKALIDRFFEALFGSNKVSPTKSEYGMYLAKTSALRSLDLSRQVGAAILNDRGDVVTMGCNEVPRPFGGAYWCDDGYDHRDYVIGHDENERIKKTIIADTIRRLSESGLIENKKTLDEIVDYALSEVSRKGSSLRDAHLMDLLEYGRIIHAEMSAITDAARLGKPLAGTTLYCTTFPCHLCAKHIVSSGIHSVSYIEPYPKSYAEHLHGDSISVHETGEQKKVAFRPFIGVSPFRYRELFEREKRKDDQGKFTAWNASTGKPRVTFRLTVPTYLYNEVVLSKRFKKAATTLVKDGSISLYKPSSSDQKTE